MQPVEVDRVAKSFGSMRAVADVSFVVGRGEILGLLGPNGAGKTTTIRMILDILRPERGSIRILGGPMDERKKDRIGYMPEERGLYQDISLEKCLLYLASLKAVPSEQARERMNAYLERFDLAAHRRKKVKDLSKGMQQKAQIISTVLHCPELVVIDEPFSALDPINSQLVKALLRELRGEGVAILMSTHQMHQAEELCDRIVLIDEGRTVLSGRVDHIRRQYAGDALLVRTAGELPRLPGVQEEWRRDGERRLALAEGTAPQAVLQALVAQGVILERFEVAMPTLEEVFVRAVGGGA